MQVLTYHDDTMRGATLMMGVHHSIFSPANSVPHILYKSCNIQKVVLHKQKKRLASMFFVVTFILSSRRFFVAHDVRGEIMEYGYMISCTFLFLLFLDLLA